MFGSFLPSLRSFESPQSTRVEVPTLLCNQVGLNEVTQKQFSRQISQEGFTLIDYFRVRSPVLLLVQQVASDDPV